MAEEASELQGKRVLITGGARRIGRALSRAFAQAGANVALTYRNSQAEAEDTDDRRDRDDGKRNFCCSKAARVTGFAKAVKQNDRPHKIELLFDAERPEVLDRPHAGVDVVMHEEESTENVDAIERQAPGPAEEEEHANISVKRRQNAHGPAKIKAAHADGAAFLLLVEQKAGDEVAADDEEDKDAGATVEDGVPDEGDVVSETKVLNGVKSNNEKDGERTQPIQTGDAGHGRRAWGEGFCRHEWISLG